MIRENLLPLPGFEPRGVQTVGQSLYLQIVKMHTDPTAEVLVYFLWEFFKIVIFMHICSITCYAYISNYLNVNKKKLFLHSSKYFIFELHDEIFTSIAAYRMTFPRHIYEIS